MFVDETYSWTWFHLITQISDRQVFSQILLWEEYKTEVWSGY